MPDHVFDRVIGHLRKQADLRFKGGAHLPAKFRQIHFLDGVPAAIGGRSQCADFWRGNFFTFQHIKTRHALAERNQKQMLLNPVENFFVRHGGDFFRPVFTAIIQPVQAGKHDADGIL